MSFIPSQKFIYNTPGNYTWICPTNVNYINLIIIGAGGGGGGGGGGAGGCYAYYSASGYNQFYSGGGGASGGCGVSGNLVNTKYVQVTPGASYQIIVGSSGTGGSAGAGSASGFTVSSPGGNGNSGTYGTDSSFTFPNGMQFIANGGVGGTGGNGGHAVTYSAGNGAPGASSNTTGYYDFNYQPPYAVIPIGADGSEAGLYGNSSTSTATANYAGTTQTATFGIYQIYTDVADSVLTYPGANLVFGPFGDGNPNFNGNTLIDTSQVVDSPLQTGAYSKSGLASVYLSTDFINGGGAGGVIGLVNPIPLYMIGVNFGAISTITLPYIHSTNGNGLGNGGGEFGSGATPSGSSIGMWRDNTATQIGYGAGGIGGPGGGGSSGGDSNVQGGSGYHGDNGLGGFVMISTT